MTNLWYAPYKRKVCGSRSDRALVRPTSKDTITAEHRDLIVVNAYSLEKRAMSARSRGSRTFLAAVSISNQARWRWCCSRQRFFTFFTQRRYTATSITRTWFLSVF